MTTAQIQENQPLVSIIIPVYNTERYIDKTLDSVLAQSLNDIEVICVDDGSTDSSKSVLEARAKLDSRLRVYHQNNSGAGAARNFGLSKSTGKYCLFVDADDFLESNALEVATQAALNNEADVVIFGLDQYLEQKDCFKPMPWAIVEEKLPLREVFNPSEVPNFYKYVVGFTHCKLYDLGYLKNLRLAFPPIGAHEDMPFTYVACSKTDRALILPETLYHYRRQREGSLSDSTLDRYVFMLEALEYFKHDLMETNCWQDNERNYYNYVLHMVTWKYGTLQGDLRNSFVNDLRNEWYSRLKIDYREDGYYYIPEEVKFFSWSRHHSYVIELELRCKKLQAENKKLRAKTKKMKKELDGQHEGSKSASIVQKAKRFLKSTSTKKGEKQCR